MTRRPLAGEGKSLLALCTWRTAPVNMGQAGCTAVTAAIARLDKKAEDLS